MKRCWGFLLLSSFLFLLIGCASFTAQRISQSFERSGACQEFFERLDEKVKEAGVRDGSSAPVSGFPYLRTTRFLSALKERLKDDREREEWVEWMLDLNLQAREKEIRNLPEPVSSSFSSDREGLLSQMKVCSQELLKHDRTKPHFYSLLEPEAVVQDEYSFLMRAAGLYPLFALPVSAVAEKARRKMRNRFGVDLEEIPKEGTFRAYVPEKRNSLSAKEFEQILRTSRKNSLKTPRLDEDGARRLVAYFAPVFIQDVAASYDRIGRVYWKDGRAEVDPEKPAVYYYFSNGFLKGEPILQINYVIWYSGRKGENPPWIEKGHLDGLTIRLSLDSHGTPFMVDVQNNCGCYHFFIPEKERVDRILSRPLMFDPLILQCLPEVSTGNRLGILINSGWHQPQRLLAMGESRDSVPYELLPYDLLESLPHEDGRRESLFDEKGIAKGSERVERFILFSMGIPSIGSMRQRGHHAIELIGRVHFDDPYLFDKNFIFK
jgi:hypothetical protein